MSNNYPCKDIVEFLDGFRRNTLNKIARWSYRRRIPSTIRRDILALWENQCAICKLKHGESFALEIAHIEPAEEGGEIAFINLIPLCKRGCRSIFEVYEKEKTIEDIGCHHLYDNEGTWSRQQIRGLDYCNKHRPGLNRPSVINPIQLFALSLKERVEHKLSWPTKGKNPLPEIKLKLNENLDWREKIDLLICGLRLARRPFPHNSLTNLSNEVKFFCEKLSELEIQTKKMDEKERIRYEKAMVHFEFGEFD